MRRLILLLCCHVLLAIWTIATATVGTMVGTAAAATGVHTTYLWHMHQPIYWPDESTWTSGRYETAYETITFGHSQNDEFEIFNKDDRVGDYQWYPMNAIASVLDLPDAGAQVSFAGALIENISSLADAGWNGGRYAPDWTSHYRTARGWTTSTGRPRLEPVLVGFHHAIAPLMDDVAFRMELACAREIYGDAWGAGDISRGFFPAEMCFSERLIPALVDAGVDWSVVADLHIARACDGYPYDAGQDNCDPPNRSDKLNPSQALWTNHTISRGVSLKIPYPYGFTPHRARHVDPATGALSEIVVVPAANAMGWEEGYGMFGTGGIDAIAPANDPTRPMLVLFAHDGDNAWSGGYSYYYESVTNFAHTAAAAGYTPTTVATYLDRHPVPAGDLVHVEDGGWVNADGDFGSPQFINWNWPLVNQAGAFDIPAGWAEDQRNWAVLTAAQNRVETAEQIAGPADPARVVDPTGGGSAVETAWHFLLAGYESGYMYYGTSLDMEIKATLACNEAVAAADPVIAGGTDLTAPTVWLPQRLPWNPGGWGGGSLWGWPGGDGLLMSSDFHVWTFAYDAGGLARIELMVREDADGLNDTATIHNETYAGGADVGAWTATAMNHRAMPLGEPWGMGGVDFTELPTYIADEYWLLLSGYSEVLLDYYVETEDIHGNVKRTPIQHVWVGEDGGASANGFVMDGELDDNVVTVPTGDGLTLWAGRKGDVLYLACESAERTANLDHFLLVANDTLGLGPAVWGKNGWSVFWDCFLGAENDNGWTGWFDWQEGLLGGPFGMAQGTGSSGVLEGTVDLMLLWGPSLIPETIWIAAAAYETADLGVLVLQAPAGDGDGHLEATEFYPFNDLAGVPDRTGSNAGWSLALHPNPFNPRVTVDLVFPREATYRVAVYDLAGKLVRSLFAGQAAAGPAIFRWDGRANDGSACASGTFLVRASDGTRSVAVKGLLVR